MRSGVIAKGGSLLTERPLAMRERSLSGSGWKVCEICGATQEMMHYNYRRGSQSIRDVIVKHRYRRGLGTPSLWQHPAGMVIA